MKQIFVNIGVERGLFGFVKSFMKQRFKERLWEFMPDKTECGDNWPKVNAAFATAVLMLAKIWDNPDCLSLVARTIRVLISFNSDYSTWKVEIAPYGFGPQLHEEHPDFNSFAEKEKSQIFEKYGFTEEEPPKKFEVSYGGRKTIMSGEQLNNFNKDMDARYPYKWPENSRAREVE